MSKSVTPGWPESGVFPFMPFPLPGTASSNATGPLMQGLTGGIDLMKNLIGQLPGGAQLPGFMVPTVDVDELDKRIGDLKAAESWVEVNLNLLRATIQGLEVQRHTIVAIRSITAPIEKPAPAEAPAATSLAPGWPVSTTEAPAAPAPEESQPMASGAAATWLGYLQDQFAKVAEAAIATGMPATKTAVRRATTGTRKPKRVAKSARKSAT